MIIYKKKSYFNKLFPTNLQLILLISYDNENNHSCITIRVSLLFTFSHKIFNGSCKTKYVH